MCENLHVAISYITTKKSIHLCAMKMDCTQETTLTKANDVLARPLQSMEDDQLKGINYDEGRMSAFWATRSNILSWEKWYFYRRSSSSHKRPQYFYSRSSRPKLWTLFLLFLLVCQLSTILVLAADDDGFDDDYLSNSAYVENTYYVQPTAKPTSYPTTHPTQKPTLSPTYSPTKSPSARPSWSNELFYGIESDDGYTAEAQEAKIYFSRMSDVILCLICTFFWMLWLVGSIFPTKISSLYKHEGVVVRGYVVESYISTNAEDVDARMQMEMEMQMMQNQMGDDMDMQMMQMQMEMEHMKSMGGLDGIGKHSAEEIPPSYDVPEPELGINPTKSSTSNLVIEASGDDENGMDALPTYHAIITYIVPGRIASGRRKRRFALTKRTLNNRYPKPSLSPVNENYELHKDSFHLNTNQNHISNRSPMTPPRNTKKSPPSSPMSTEAIGERESSFGSTGSAPRGRRKLSLIDTHDSETVDTNWQGNDKGYYKYNICDESDYETPMNDDEFEEDPEYIGNPFYDFGFFERPRKAFRPCETIRVKKRFETNELLEPGLGNVEIIVLPGQPGSGVIRHDFEMDEENQTGILKTGSSHQMSSWSMTMIGIVLAAVSVIGAVNGALTLPYTERACKYHG